MRCRFALVAAAVAPIAALALAACHRTPATLSGPKPADPAKTYTAEIQTSMGNIDVVLFPKQAPLAVGNFVGLATGTQPWRNPISGQIMHQPLYNNTIFHRVIPKFMIQGGDPMGNGTGDPGYEFADEVTPELKYDRPGRLGMANSGPNTNGCQFFITTVPYHSLNGHYTIFGQVTAGQDVVDAISNVPRDPSNNRPLKPIRILRIAVQIH
ncbi:MAG: peptidylprolyl isomerase [Terriglobales bacterium]